ncbi:MAG: cobalt transporter CbiM [Rhodovulum sulfidophilum]|uniref:Cobalt transporter CbiM n=1 Tax=Rhodovulum sulfidophilum TaxID=35806 RepID=A0A2W5PYW0_RHOSU|nr:MAG: cobalt transporter CbiM [Rhodovulum sulfidophilum]
MAHIQDGLLSAPVLVGGALLTLGACACALRRTSDAEIVRAAVLGSVFFAGSLIAIPIGPSSVHPMFSALMGLVLGWMAFPTVLAALVLQLVLFGFGGVTTLGVNAFNIAMPGVAAGLLLRNAIAAARPERAAWLAGAGAAAATLGTAGLVALSLALSASAYVPAARVLAITYLPLAAIEAAVCAGAVAYLRRARPGIWTRAAS